MAILSVRAVGVFRDFAASIRYPFGLEYGEGIVWQQAALIPGPHMYGTAQDLPFIVFHYPPLYYLLARAALSIVPDFLAAVFTKQTQLPAGIAVFLIALMRNPRAARGAAAIAGLSGLAALGRWNEGPLVTMIRSGGFAFMITTDNDVGGSERRTPSVNAAMRQAYRRVEKPTPFLWLHLPLQ